MRKLISISIAFVYLFLSTGILLNVHYCHGEVESVSILSEGANCCCGHELTDGGCCKNEQYFFQFNLDDQLVGNSISIEVYKTIDLAGHVKFNFGDYSVKVSDYFPSDSSPPPKLTIWKTNCSFLFYG